MTNIIAALLIFVTLSVTLILIGIIWICYQLHRIRHDEVNLNVITHEYEGVDRY